MSLYRMVFGESPWPTQIMGMFGLTPQMIGRYRDHWCEKDGEDALVCAVYTRNGGGNREEHAQQIAEMQSLPTYVSDADDSFDSTYATFRFRMTKDEVYAWMREHMAEDPRDPETGEPITLDDTWEEIWREAEPAPRDMAVVWRAMIATLPAHGPDEKV